MNSLHRVLTTLQGGFADRRAVGLTLSLYGARLTDCPLERYYSDPIAYADGMSAVLDEFRPDWLISPFAVMIEGEAFGSQTEIRGRQAPILVHPVIETADEIDRLVIPDVDSHPRLLYIRRTVQTLVSRHGNELPTCAVLLGPAELPAVIMGLDAWLTTFLFNKTNRDRVFGITVPYFVRWANALLADGASTLIVPNLFASPKILTRELAEEIVRPVLQQAFSQVRGPILLHHMSNPLAPFIDVFVGLPNVIGFVADPRDDFSEMRAKIGPDYVLLGGIDGPTLHARTPSEIAATCLAVLEDRCDDPRFLLATTAADVGFDTPPEQIHAVREAAESFGRGVVHAG